MTENSSVMTLKAWQSLPKEASPMIVQASSVNGRDDWQSFPIGMSWQFAKIYYQNEYRPIGPHDLTVLCAIKPHTDSYRRQRTGRPRFLQILSSNGIHNQHLDPKSYYDALPRYKFVISPEGNGFDCHRHYEAFFAGCIPIMEENEKIRQKYEGCPILWTKDYSEITEEYLLQKYKDMQDEVYNFERLFLDFYTLEQIEEIKMCGNYWIQKMVGVQWYR